MKRLCIILWFMTVVVGGLTIFSFVLSDKRLEEKVIVSALIAATLVVETIDVWRRP